MVWLSRGCRRAITARIDRPARSTARRVSSLQTARRFSPSSPLGRIPPPLRCMRGTTSRRWSMLASISELPQRGDPCVQRHTGSLVSCWRPNRDAAPVNSALTADAPAGCSVGELLLNAAPGRRLLDRGRPRDHLCNRADLWPRQPGRVRRRRTRAAGPPRANPSPSPVRLRRGLGRLSGPVT